MYTRVTILLRVVMAVAFIAALGSLGPTPANADLLDSAKNGDGETVTKSLEVEDVDPTLLRRPLFFAAQRGHAPVVAVLLEKDADFNFRNDRGRPPIHNAMAAGRTEMAEFLRANGAAPNLQGNRVWN